MVDKPPIKTETELDEFFKTLQSEFDDNVDKIKKFIGDYLEKRKKT